MTLADESLAELAARFLDGHPAVSAVRPKTGASSRVHLSVYATAEGCPIGAELDHRTQVNLWVPRDWVAVARLSGVPSVVKTWTGDPAAPWRGTDGRGANSNLRGYDGFRGHDLIRFAIRSEREFHMVMAEVLR